MLWVSVGIGLVISLVFAEWLGLAAGGLVVPGYIALFWDKPMQILSTLIAAILSLLALKLLSQFTFVYGRRRMVLTILLGFLFGSLIRNIIPYAGPFMNLPFDPIGFVIPGLLAYWMEKQGVIETLSAMVVASALVRFAVILINGGAPIAEVWF